MNFSTGVLAAALLAWGWHNELLLVALPLAALIELPRWMPWRWELSDRDFRRLADVSTLGFVLLAVYQFDARGASGIYAILLWLPVAMFPLTATQIFSTRERIDYTALFWSVRGAVARGKTADPGVYALVGFLLFLFRHAKTETLLGLALVLMLFHYGNWEVDLIRQIVRTPAGEQSQTTQSVAEVQAKATVQVETNLRVYGQGSFSEIMTRRVQAWFDTVLGWSYPFKVVLALFLLGLW